MNIRNTAQSISLAALAATLPALLAIAAHAQTPAATSPQTPPGAVKVLPPLAGADAASSSAVASTLKDVTVGSAVFGSDGQKIGEIKGVKADPAGKIEEIHVKTGGVLGFGGKVVVIPGAKIAKGGQSVQVAMTLEEIGKLPVLADKKG